jgi:hypothetical protein
MKNRLYRVAWAIVADGTLFKGDYCVIADDEAHAIERTKEAMGQEGNAATFVIKSAAERVLELKRAEYPSDAKGETPAWIAEAPKPTFSVARFVYDVAARANVIASSEQDAVSKLGHALTGKDVPAVKFMRTKAVDPEPMDALSNYEKHMLEKQFRSVRVSST